jgi:hypothetical protein
MNRVTGEIAPCALDSFSRTSARNDRQYSAIFAKTGFLSRTIRSDTALEYRPRHAIFVDCAAIGPGKNVYRDRDVLELVDT